MLNYWVALPICALKAALLLRAWPLAWFGAYLAASLGTSAMYVLRLHGAEAGWNVATAVLLVCAAIEAVRVVSYLVSDEQQREVMRWCGSVGLLMVYAVAVGEPLGYVGYSDFAYLARLYLGAFTVGLMAGLLGWCFACDGAWVRSYVWHAGVIFFRAFVFTDLLMVRDRGMWFQWEFAGELANLASLAAWFWILPRRVQAPIN